MKKVLLTLAFLAAIPLPARASTITIDSSNCNSGGGCYGLAWTLTVNSGPFVWAGDAFGYEALLQLTDDSALTGNPSVVISAVDFKVSSSVEDDAVLHAVPGSTTLGKWETSAAGLNSKGCTGSGSGFVCSQASLLPSDPANFVASSSAQTWAWYFNTTVPLFTDLAGAHIGAKMTDLSNPGKLLSASYTAVPEPSTFLLLLAGASAAFRFRRRVASPPSTSRR